MMKMKRYAVYYAPRAGEFAEAAASWLGWDVTKGCDVDQPSFDGLHLPLSELTKAPRKYGFHGTIRAPFRVASNVSETEVRSCVAELARNLAPLQMEGLRLEVLHGFLAFTPKGDLTELMTLGAAVVKGTNALRAPLTDAERARRNPEKLSPRQIELLDLYGYPSVMEEFKFHLTLSDHLTDTQIAPLQAVAETYFLHVMPEPFEIEDLCLFGEDMDGRFHLIHRYALTG